MEETRRKILVMVLSRIKPDSARKDFVLSQVDSAISKLRSHLELLDKELEVRLEGSVAKDTWINFDVDADVFILFPTKYDKSEMGEIATKETIKTFGEANCVMRYAEHPYVTVNLGALNIDVVPCFKVEPPNWKSATDRTIYHTKFVVEKFDEKLKDEARLLKALIMGIGRYGAEIKIGGFSGFLCELLVYHFGDFLSSLKAFSNLRLPLVIDIEGYHKGKTEEEISEKFNSKFVVVDPTDPQRNVASAVSQESLCTFVWASRRFLAAPSEELFFPNPLPKEIEEYVVERIRMGLLNSLALRFPIWKAPPDILWGQLNRIRRRFETSLTKAGYSVAKSTCWSDEKSEAFIIYVLVNDELPMTELRRGPNALDFNNSEAFISKYEKDEYVVSGPYIKDDRWYVLRRRISNITNFLTKSLSDEKFLEGMPEESVNSIKNSRILTGEDILSAVKMKDGREFILKFLHGKEWWL